MIPLLAAVEVVRLRFAAVDDAAFTDGTYVRPDPTESTIRASVVPASASARREWLPEGEERREAVEVVSYTEIRGRSESQQLQPDRLRIDGRTYEVAHAEKLPAFFGQPAHWEAVAVELQAHQVTP